MEKTIWRMGHILSMLGFIDQACIFRHLAARWDQPDCDGKTQALAALESLPHELSPVAERLRHVISEKY